MFFGTLDFPGVIILPFISGDTAFGTARMVNAAFTIRAVNERGTEFLLDDDVSYYKVDIEKAHLIH